MRKWVKSRLQQAVYCRAEYVLNFAINLAYRWHFDENRPIDRQLEHLQSSWRLFYACVCVESAEMAQKGDFWARWCATSTPKRWGVFLDRRVRLACWLAFAVGAFAAAWVKLWANRHGKGHLVAISIKYSILATMPHCRAILGKVRKRANKNPALVRGLSVL